MHRAAVPGGRSGFDDRVVVHVEVGGPPDHHPPLSDHQSSKPEAAPQGTAVPIVAIVDRLRMTDFVHIGQGRSTAGTQHYSLRNTFKGAIPVGTPVVRRQLLRFVARALATEQPLEGQPSF